MLDRPLYDEWLKRLRSGSYAQGNHALCSITPEGRRYCCLGVLAEIMVEADLMHRFDGEHDTTYDGDGMANEDPQVYLPPELIHGEVQRKLAVLNDSAGYTFLQIADEIERSYELAITDPPVPYEDADQRLGGNDA